jgi:DNA-binding HxlR family transcriptional regulator
MKDYLDIILGTLAVIGAIYRLAQVEANINARISRLETTILVEVDQTKDGLTERLNKVEQGLAVHLVEYSEKKLFAEYRFNAIDKTVEHKFNRLANWITQIAGFLHKQSGFQIRDDKF